MCLLFLSFINIGGGFVPGRAAGVGNDRHFAQSSAAALTIRRRCPAQSS